jgi:hypothetical protein
MKKIGKTIAIVLVLVILAGCFMGCCTAYALKDSGREPLWLLVFPIPFFPALDLVTLPFQIIVWIITQNPPWEWVNGEPETKTYMAKAEFNTFTEYYSLLDKMNSLPKTELALIAETLNSIPETERNSTKEKINSLPEEKINSMVRAYNSIPEKEIIASMKRINSLSKPELVSLLQSFNNLSEDKIDSIIMTLNNSSETENVAFDNDLSETKGVSIVYGQIIPQPK